MKVVKFTISNYKSIRGTEEFTPLGSSFFLIGGNGKGKTSAGKALIDLLTKNFPSKPVTDGEEEGFVEVTLDNGQVISCRFLDGKKPLLEIIDESGESIGAPKDVLKRLTGDGMAFSIDELLSLQPMPLRAKMEAIVGLDLTDLDNKEKKAVEDRRQTKILYEAQLAKAVKYDKSLVTKEIVSVVELANQRSEILEKFNAHKELVTLVDHTKEMIANKKEAIEGIQAQIIALSEKLEEAEAEQKLLISKLDERIEVARISEEALDPDGLLALESKLETAEEDNKKIAEAIRIKDEHDKAAKLKKDVDALEAQVDKIRKDKDAAIKKCPLPAEGLEFGPDGNLLLDGVPFEDNQIATSRKIIAGIQIAQSMIGEIKYLHFDGAALDKESADHILEYAEAHGLQLCVERPSWEGGALKMEIYEH